MDRGDLVAFEEEIRTRIPDFRVAFKDESLLMKVLGVLVKPFNPDFMTRYTTTLGSVVYFPSRDHYEEFPRSSIAVLAHEVVHILDSKKHPLWYPFSYLFPQVLAPVALVGYMAYARTQAWPMLGVVLGGLLGWGAVLAGGAHLGVCLLLLGVVSSVVLAYLYTGWVAGTLLLLSLLLLAPWPAPFRVHWEQRGYAVNIRIAAWNLGFVPQVYLTGIVYHFVGPSYYFMSWSKKTREEWAKGVVNSALVIPKEDPYPWLKAFLTNRR